jgi:thymidylate synthase (FAD)
MEKVKFITATPDAEKLIAYCARVSNPENQDNENYSRLLAYCINHGHWSIFEMANMVLEINTSRGIAAQVLRHRSFSFQEFSQRYADANLLEDILAPDLRLQDTKNRQNSIDGMENADREAWSDTIEDYFQKGQDIYNKLLKTGVAKECARFVLPLATPTKMYMNGTIRSWIHYINLRSANGTQKEHMDIANQCKAIFIEKYPLISESLDW